jgi:hypothetical protein
MTINRRNLTKGVAWSVPVVAISTAAPAFAASQSCKPFAECKNPGAGQNSKTYIVNSNCGLSESTVTSVTVDGQPTTPLGNGRYETVNFNDSRNFRTVVVTFSDRPTETYENVPFPPCNKDAA